jgi:hypothetical protein
MIDGVREEFRRRLICSGKSSAVRDRSQNSQRTRQAVRGIKEMFRKDGLL